MDTRRSLTLISLALLVTFVILAFAAASAFASTEGRRNTALGLTAGAIYAAVTGKKTAAVALGAGAAYAWKRHADDRANTAYQRGYRDASWGRRGGYAHPSSYSYRSGYSYRTVCAAPQEHRGWSQGRHGGWDHSNYDRCAAGRRDRHDD